MVSTNITYELVYSCFRVFVITHAPKHNIKNAMYTSCSLGQYNMGLRQHYVAEGNLFTLFFGVLKA